MPRHRTAPGPPRRRARARSSCCSPSMLVVLLLVSALAVDYGGWLVDEAELPERQRRRGARRGSAAHSTADGRLRRRTEQELLRSPGGVGIREAALGFTTLDPAAQAAGPAITDSHIVENDYKVWVASPPADAGSALSRPCQRPGERVRPHRARRSVLPLADRLDRQDRDVRGPLPAGSLRTSPSSACAARPASPPTAWPATRTSSSTATTRTSSSDTGDSGRTAGPSRAATTAAWPSARTATPTCSCSTPAGQLGGNQCQLWGYNSPQHRLSDDRAAIPLGAPIRIPAYPRRTINNTDGAEPVPRHGHGPAGLGADRSRAAPRQIPAPTCRSPRGGGADSSRCSQARGTNNDLAGFVKATVGGAALNGITVTAVGPTTDDDSRRRRRPIHRRRRPTAGTYTITATRPGRRVYHGGVARRDCNPDDRQCDDHRARDHHAEEPDDLRNRSGRARAAPSAARPSASRARAARTRHDHRCQRRVLDRCHSGWGAT